MSNKPKKQSSYKDSLEFAQIAQSVGEVDDFVLHEFLTDLIDSAPDASGVAAPKVQQTGEALPKDPRGSLGSAGFGAEVMTDMNARFPSVGETDAMANDAMHVDSCVFVPGTAPVKSRDLDARLARQMMARTTTRPSTRRPSANANARRTSRRNGGAESVIATEWRTLSRRWRCSGQTRRRHWLR